MRSWARGKNKLERATHERLELIQFNVPAATYHGTHSHHHKSGTEHKGTPNRTEKLQHQARAHALVTAIKHHEGQLETSSKGRICTVALIVIHHGRDASCQLLG